MRFSLYLFCLFALAGCVNFAGMHSHSKPLTASDLSTHHVYKTHAVTISKKSLSSKWWERFSDKQLNQLIAIALLDSPTMKIAESRVRRAQQVADAAESPLWPSIDASGYLQRQRFSASGLIPPPFNGRTFNIGELGLDFNYEFDFWGKNRALLASRLSEECAAEADFAAARLILAGAVAHTYFERQRTIAQINVANLTLKDKQTSLQIVADRAKHGLQSDIPVKQALSDVQALKLIVAEYREAEKIARHRLAVLLGKNPFETEMGTRQFSYRKHHVMIPASLPANLLAARPDILAARLRAEAAAYQVKVAKARFFPNINLNALFSYQSILMGQLFNKNSQNNAITGAIDLPIFDAGLRRANLGIQYAEYDLAVNQYNKTILVALREVADQLSLLKSLNGELRVQAEAVNAIKQNYKLTNLRYRHGIVDYQKVLEIKEFLLSHKAIQIDLQARHLQAYVALIVALGGL